MELFIAGRQGGKTHHLVRLAAADPDVLIVVADEAKKEHVVGLLFNELLDRLNAGDIAGNPSLLLKQAERQVCTAWYLAQFASRSNQRVVVDNIDLVLGALLRHSVSLGTFTGPATINDSAGN